MKRIVEIIVKDVLLTEAREKYPYTEEVAQFLASLTSELSRCVSCVGLPSLCWLMNLITAPESQKAAQTAAKDSDMKGNLRFKIPNWRLIGRHEKKVEKAAAYCHIQMTMSLLNFNFNFILFLLFLIEILRKQRAHWKEPGRDEEQNETGTCFPNI